MGRLQSNEGADMYKRILIPIDGSRTASRGLDEAIALARQLKATLRVLNLTGDFPATAEMAGGIDYEQYRPGLNQFGRSLLDKASTQATAQGVVAETSLHDLRGGRVADAIVEEAISSHCDLIVIGTHGRRGLSRALLGSDAEIVMRHSPVPVLLVREPTTAA
jgi:nucleotide-binding universal stress UspA family protein